MLIILTKAIIYDEIRHVLFLVPLIMIISFVSLFNFLSKNIIFIFFNLYIFSHSKILKYFHIIIYG